MVWAMDIKVGAVVPAQLAEAAARGLTTGAVEAMVLAVRMPRGARGGDQQRSSTEERRKRRSVVRNDPPGSRVLMLLVPDPAGIPADFDSVPYRVVVRFVRVV